jgi:OmpA-OmpF porin, OOP family
MRWISVVAVTLGLFVAAPLSAQEDAQGCKDHSLFTRFPGTHITACQSSQFDMRAFPVGAPREGQETLEAIEVEGPVQLITYQLNEGVTPPSGLQIMRNFENAAKKAGGTVEGRHPGWCKAMYDSERMPGMGNGCTSYALTLKFLRGGKETWVFLQAGENDGAYVMTVSDREEMKQDITVNELADQFARDGFLTLYVNFDTGKSTITSDSAKTLDDAAGALRASGDLAVEVGGHTDNVGTPEANQRLSQERAQAVMAALVERGITADRLTAKGFGQTSPIADNRTEDGRARNRRVELVKK